MSSPQIPEWREGTPVPASVGTPAVSIIVVSTGVRRRLLHRLEAVSTDARRTHAEIIVITAGPLAWLAEAARHFPAAHFVEAPSGSSVTELRCLGASHATGQVLMMTTDAPDPPATAPLQIALGSGAAVS